MDINFQVTSGPQAHVGTVQVTGEPGMSVEAFQRYGRLKAGGRIDHDTVSRALSGVLKHYQKEQRLEADVKLESQIYSADTKRTNFRFAATRGPIVRLLLEGAGLGRRAAETGDPDLRRRHGGRGPAERGGDRRLRDYYQRLGYFDVKVQHQNQTPQPDEVTILYTVTLGTRRKVESVSIDGNHYFDTATLKDLLSVHAADTLGSPRQL